MIKGSDFVRGKIPQKGPYSLLLDATSQVIEEKTFREFRKSFSTESIRELVSKRVRDFGGDFLRRFGDEYRWVSVRVLFDESLAPEEVVLCFREVDQEKQRQLPGAGDAGKRTGECPPQRENEACVLQQHVPRHGARPSMPSWAFRNWCGSMPMTRTRSAAIWKRSTIPAASAGPGQ